MKNPVFSVIIPTYNRRDVLTKCINSLCRLNYSPEKFEVIIVNDGGKNNLDKLIDSYDNKINISVVNIKNSGPAFARNAGAEKAKGEYLTFTDDDCEADPNWLIAYEEKLRNNSNSLIGGQTISPIKDNVYSITSHAIIEIVYNYYNKDPENALFFASNNIALSKKLFKEIGGFDKTFRTAEDRDLCYRWRNKGLTIKYNENAIIYHSHILSFHTFFKQHFTYGRGSYLYFKKSKDDNLVYFSNLLKFNFNPNNLFIYPFSKYHTPLGYSITPLLILWQIANATGFIFELFNQQFRHIKNSNTILKKL